MSAPPTFVAVIPNGRVVGADGAVVSPDDALLGDVSVDLRVVNTGEAQGHAIRRMWRLPPVKTLRASVAVLSVLGGHNYFHWMFHLLPRIELLRRTGAFETVDCFLTNELQAPFQSETLMKLGLPRDRVLQGGAGTHMKADRLVVPSRPSRMSEMPAWVCDLLRETFLDKCSPMGAGSRLPTRLYLARPQSTHRKVLNEREVLALLGGLGFTSVSLERMSVGDQARLLNSATHIVAPHGAALANLAFCQVGVTLIEIFSPRYINACYWALSNLVGGRYFFVFGRGHRPQRTPEVFDMFDDIVVDLPALSQVLALAGVEHG